MQLLSVFCISNLFLLLLCWPTFAFGQQSQVIFAMLGDSTTASKTGYADCLKYEFKGAIILNFGASGSTSRSFFYENLPWAMKSIRRYRQAYPHHKIVCSQAFGHNDQGHSNHNSDALKAEKVNTGQFSRFSAAIHRGLEKVCDEAVFTTPIERRIYQANGQFKPTLQTYADATIKAARWTDSKVIDLHASSVNLLQALPADIAKKDFNRKLPASQGEDDTHLDEKGCKTFAALWATRYKSL